MRVERLTTSVRNLEARRAVEEGEAEAGAGGGERATGCAGSRRSAQGPADPGYVSRCRPDRPQGRQQRQEEAEAGRSRGNLGPGASGSRSGSEKDSTEVKT